MAKMGILRAARVLRISSSQGVRPPTERLAQSSMRWAPPRSAAMAEPRDSTEISRRGWGLVMDERLSFLAAVRSKRDFSLREPTNFSEEIGKAKASVCSVRNDGF